MNKVKEKLEFRVSGERKNVKVSKRVKLDDMPNNKILIQCNSKVKRGTFFSQE